jgi:hypothetical protein
MAKKKVEEVAEVVEAEEVKAEEATKKVWIKVWTEEELAVLPREEFQKVEADIRNGKATVKPRFED